MRVVSLAICIVLVGQGTCFLPSQQSPASLSSSRTDKFQLFATRPKPLSVEEIKAQMGMEKDNAPAAKLFSDDLYDDMQQTLLILEKRISNGPGSVSTLELDDLNVRTERIVQQMWEYEESRIDESIDPAPIAAMEEFTAAVEEPSDFVNEEAVYSPVVDQMPKNLEVVDDYQLRIAASNMDATKVTELLDLGFEMDEETTDAAFWAVVDAVDRAEQADQPLSADVSRMLHHIFFADQLHLQKREKIGLNITCKQPDDTDVGGAARRMNYIFDDSSHKDLPLKEGRCCEGGNCCDKCSRNIFPTFASDAESSLETFPELASFSFNELETVSSSTILQFVRLVERVRRTISHEYGVPLKTILPLQAYSRKYVAGTTQQGGGGGEGDFVTLHTDEATHSGYHYSCVLYLSTQGADFEGGDFVFNDPAEDGYEPTEEEKMALQIMPIEEQMRRAGRTLTPFHPSRGAAVIFSSGWENMHEVEKITSGVRYAVPCFFTTCPVPEAAYEQMAQGKPQTDEEIADDWLHLLLAHRKESPMEAVGRVKELLMKWNMLCSPLDQH